VSTGAPRKRMRHQSYLRTVAGGAGKIIPALRPPRMSVWGLRRSAKDFADLPSSPLTDPGLHSELSWRERGPVAPSTQPQARVQNDRQTSAPALTASVQGARGIHDKGASTAIESLSDRHTISILSSSVSLGEAAPLELTSPRPSRGLHNKSETKNQARREARKTRTSDDRKALCEVVPQFLRSRSKSVQVLPQSTISGRKDGVEAPRKANQVVSSLREAPPALRDGAQSVAATKQADISRSGNDVHIGTVDIHMHSSPSQVLQHIVRQPVSVAPITRGFPVFFGLRQG
jgi:hypothetical protein